LRRALSDTDEVARKKRLEEVFAALQGAPATLAWLAPHAGRAGDGSRRVAAR
jgi:hypothetical protein